MSGKNESKVSNYLKLLFQLSFGVLILSILFSVIDWYIFDEKYR